VNKLLLRQFEGFDDNTGYIKFNLFQRIISQELGVQLTKHEIAAIKHYFANVFEPKSTRSEMVDYHSFCMHCNKIYRDESNDNNLEDTIKSIESRFPMAEKNYTNAVVLNNFITVIVVKVEMI
jgi:hypothetical protein